MFPVRKAHGLLLAALFAAPAASQVITVTPSNPVPGATVDVGFSNPNTPNQTVTITITYGSPAKSVTLSMLLDGSGVGSKQFTIPNVPPTIRFNAPNAQEVVIFIL